VKQTLENGRLLTDLNLHPTDTWLGPVTAFTGGESTSLCHGQIRVLISPRHTEVDSRPWTSFNRFKSTPHRHMTCTCDCIYRWGVYFSMSWPN